MASEKNICIDYAGRKVFKKLPQSVNTKKLILDLLKQNDLKVSYEDANGYTAFLCKSKTTKESFRLNIFFASFKFDTQRPNFVNINLGSNIDNPYQLSLKDDVSCKTIILGVYTFDKDDSAEDVIFVSCPIKNRNYSGNPSLRVRNELIQEARRTSDAIWTNKSDDDFRAFKLLSFSTSLIETASILSSVKTSFDV